MAGATTTAKVRNVTGGDPKRHRYGCFLSDLTGFTAVPPTTSLAGLWDNHPAPARKNLKINDCLIFMRYVKEIL
jgi:hypothetical protein